MNSDSNKPRLLLVEDEMLLAMMLEDRLVDVGYVVLKAARLTAGLALAESAALDLAILDINLAGESSFPIAEILRRRGVPFIFSSGYGFEGLPDIWRNEKVLQKPYDTQQLTTALTGLCSA